GADVAQARDSGKSVAVTVGDQRRPRHDDAADAPRSCGWFGRSAAARRAAASDRTGLDVAVVATDPAALGRTHPRPGRTVELPGRLSTIEIARGDTQVANGAWL